TLQEGIKQGYFTGSEVYDANMQEQVFREFLISKRTKISQFVRKGIGSLRDAQYDAAQEWASVAVPKGLPLKNGKISDGNKSYYEKPGQNSS
ncbi:peptidoglycan-binding protein, partial [Acinetobacter baumannii]